jgi:hypothetical protein
MPLEDIERRLVPNLNYVPGKVTVKS